MEFPDDLKYSREHEWVLVEGKVATVGISAFAESQLGDVVFVELPGAGDTVAKDEAMGVVESVKAVSSLYSPVTGEIISVNSDLPNKLESLGSDAYNAGWMIKVAVSDEAPLKNLMDAAAYEKQCAAEG